MKLNPIKLLMVVFFSLFSTAYAAQEQDHSTSHHQQMSADEKKQQTSDKPAPPLTQSGNDIFGTIQEVMTHLNADPNTDWSKVNITALKEHLLDMRDMTINVEVLSKTRLKNGSKIRIRPTNQRARQAMERVLAGHPAQLKTEANWQMQVQKKGHQYLLTTTSDKPEEINKIIGLGYIGLMAYGNHHQPHHWSIVTGSNPHAH